MLKMEAVEREKQTQRETNKLWALVKMLFSLFILTGQVFLTFSNT